MSQATTILIIEDSEVDQAMMQRVLAKLSPRAAVTVVDNGPLAIEILRERAFDLVVLDLHLGNDNGHDVLRMIRVINPTIPVIVQSSSDMEPHIEEAYQCGANSYVCKPTDSDEFIQNFEQLAAYWLHLNEVL